MKSKAVKPEIKNVIFDLGGVLIDWNPRHLYRGIFKDEKKMEEFLSTVCNREWNEKQDEGRSFADGIAEILGKFPHHKNEIEIWDTRWHEMISGAIEPTVRVLEKIKVTRKHRLFGLSNWSRDKFHVAEDSFPFIKWFEYIAVSGRVGFMKPDPRIYHHLLEVGGIQASESVFIDDVRKNIDAAAALGFQTIHFVSSNQLEQDLKSLRVL